VWPAAAGSFATVAEPVAERDGVVTVACDSAVLSSELDLMSELVVDRVNEELGRPAVKRLRTRATRT
jgi:predicted nucleic acid-binding Zn ribbon protein